MFLLFGFGKRTYQRLGSAGMRVCPICRNRAEWAYFRVRKWFTLFFVPIFPYKTQDVTICPVCGYTQEEQVGLPPVDR